MPGKCATLVHCHRVRSVCILFRRLSLANTMPGTRIRLCFGMRHMQSFIFSRGIFPLGKRPVLMNLHLSNKKEVEYKTVLKLNQLLAVSANSMKPCTLFSSRVFTQILYDLRYPASLRITLSSDIILSRISSRLRLFSTPSRAISAHSLFAAHTLGAVSRRRMHFRND